MGNSIDWERILNFLSAACLNLVQADNDQRDYMMQRWSQLAVRVLTTQPLPNLPFWGWGKKMENQAKRPKSSFIFFWHLCWKLQSLGAEWDRKDLSATEQLSARLSKHLERKTSGSSTFGVYRYLPLEISSVVLLMSGVVFFQSQM